MADRPPGLLGAAGTLFDSLLASIQNRLRILSVELQEEKLRLVQLIIWVAAAVFAAMMTVAFASVTVVYLFWQQSALAALACATLFYGVSLGVIAWQFRRYLRRQPKPFDATLGELDKDRACIRPNT